MERKDGSIGTLKIPSLDINMKVWEGETNASMQMVSVTTPRPLHGMATWQSAATIEVPNM